MIRVRRCASGQSAGVILVGKKKIWAEIALFSTDPIDAMVRCLIFAAYSCVQRVREDCYVVDSTKP